VQALTDRSPLMHEPTGMVRNKEFPQICCWRLELFSTWPGCSKRMKAKESAPTLPPGTVDLTRHAGTAACASAANGSALNFARQLPKALSGMPCASQYFRWFKSPRFHASWCAARRPRHNAAGVDSRPPPSLSSSANLRTRTDRIRAARERIERCHRAGLRRLRPPAFPTRSRPRLVGTAMEISRFPGRRLLRMPGSATTRGWLESCDDDTDHFAFCWTENISAPNLSYAAQYLATHSPVNASLAASRPHAHDSGPV
jgi:hypothetical protein